MSLIPRWRSFFPSPRRSSELFSLGKFFEDLEKDMESFSSNDSGLSVSSDAERVYIEAHVPGLTAKEVEVTVEGNNLLWIKGKKKEEERDKNRKYYRQCQSTFSYCIPLWEEIDLTAEPEAVCKDGIMRITLQKKQEQQIESKKIQVKE